MEQQLSGASAGLRSVLLSIASTVSEISVLLMQRDGGDAAAGTTNTFGDTQLQVDCAADELIFKRLAACQHCYAASSEEQPDMRQLREESEQGEGYTVVFDPLDGSSIVEAGFAVGTIFGIWPGSGVVGRTGRQQVAAAYAVYGPRTMLVWACPGPGGGRVVQQWVLSPQQDWKLLSSVSTPSPSPSSAAHTPTENGTAGTSTGLIAPTKAVFAPANLRCARHNSAYRALVDAWVDRGFTLRYTGGMVPDVHHIIAKGGGVFVNPQSDSAPAKLRLVYECAPLAFIIEAAGGASSNGRTSILDIPITTTSQKSPIVLGSTQLVQESLPAMTFQQAAVPALV